MEDFYNIMVVCDSPRHARGKVAKIVLFYRDHEAGVWLTRFGKRDRSWERRADRVSSAGFQPDVNDLLGPDLAAPLSCNLCPLQRPIPADAVLDALAAQGVSRISLSRLPLLGSS